MTGDKTRQLAMRSADRLIGLLQREVFKERLACNTGQSPGQSAKRIDTFQKGLAAIKARHAELVAQLRTSEAEAARALEPRIDAAISILKQHARKKFLPKLLHGRVLSKPRTFEVFAREVSAFCARVFNRELRLYEAALQEHLQRIAGPLLAQIRELPDEVLTIAIELDGSAGAVPKLVAEEGQAPQFNLQLGNAAPIDWRPPFPWRVYFVPLRWFRTAMQEHFGVELDRLLEEYRSNLEVTVQKALSEFTSTVGRETERRIDSTASRMTQSIRSDGAKRNRKIFEELLFRAKDLRRRLDDECAGLTHVQADDSLHPANDIGSSSPAIDMMRACPVCRAVVQAVFDHLSKLQYELSIETAAQLTHAENGGFCSTHTWIYASLTSPVAIARAYPALLDSHAARLQRAARRIASVGMLAREVHDLAPSPSVCPACSVARRAVDQSIENIFKSLDVGGRGEMPPLCLPHVEIALQHATDLESGRLLVSGCARALSRAADNMRRHALKHDAIRRGLMTSDERDAHQIGLKKLAGDMLLVLPPREDPRC